MKKVLLYFVLGMMMLGCSGKSEVSSPPPPNAIEGKSMVTSMEEPPMESDMSEQKVPPPPPAPQENVQTTNRTQKKIIHTADIRFKVEDLKKSELEIKSRVNAMGGYISNSNQNRQSGNLENSWTVRIPAEKFDTFLGDVEKESIYTDSKNISAEDVTAEYVDNELRIKSKQKVFERYLELLKQAKNVQEIMAVEEQIRVIREEIESKEGRQKYLNDQVAFSTITVSFYQETETSSAPDQPFYVKIWKSFTSGWGSFFETIIGLFAWIPYILALWAIVYFIRKWWKKRKG
jgi:SHS2 domain-containing protein